MIMGITATEMRAMLDKGYETGKYEPRGLFIAKEGFMSYAAIDNSTGDAFMEIFRTKRSATKWLKGDACEHLKTTERHYNTAIDT